MQDQLFMRRCIELASLGSGYAAPNPLVGSVIVHDEKIIGEGYHMKFGEAHAEVNAINAVENKDLLPYSTLYVNLEPCSHFGKTPPCADMIIRNKIERVVIGCTDPNPLVSGKGIEKLQNAGCTTEVGILEEECRNLNRRFLTFIKKQRPHIILKWAQTENGFIAPADRTRTDISNEFSRTLVHRWRSEESAILVGTNTALYDNPRLDSRLWNGRNPLRIVLDKNLRLPANLNLFDHSVPTLVITEQSRANETNLEFHSTDFSGDFLQRVLSILFEKHIQSVLVEGGTQLLGTFIKEGLWDEARIFTSELSFPEGVRAPQISGKKIFQEDIDTDRLIFLENV